MLERAAKAVKSHLESDLAAALDVVETYWSGQGDGVTLPDVVTWLFGHTPTVMEKARAAFPIVAVMAFEGAQASKADQYGFAEERIPVVVNWFVDEDTEEACNKLCLRYGEAITAVLREHRQLETQVVLDGYVPETRLSLVARERPDVGTTEFYTQMGQQTWYVVARS